MTIDYIAELGRAGGAFPNDLNDLAAVTTCYHYLVATDHKKDKDTGGDALRAAWGKKRLTVRVPEPDVALWQFIAAPTVDLAVLPSYSFSLSFTFTLAQPYMSKDDNAFYIIDNPIVRDKVFRLPIVRPSGWKGNLKAALRQTGHRDDEPAMGRLFGKVNEANDQGQAGRLFFYPTFFTRTSLEIINPHDRTRRVGKNPILFESVPIDDDATGQFTLLYVPFDHVGQDEGEKTRIQATADMELISEGIQAMMTVYGFGAKTSSGFGLARETVSGGTLAVRDPGWRAAPEEVQTTEAVPASSLPRYLEAPGRLHADLRAADGGPKPEDEYRNLIESRDQKYARKDRQLYEKARAWWEREGKALAEQGPASEPEPPAPAPTPSLAWPSWPFASLDELVSLVEQVDRQLAQGDA